MLPNEESVHECIKIIFEKQKEIDKLCFKCHESFLLKPRGKIKVYNDFFVSNDTGIHYPDDIEVTDFKFSKEDTPRIMVFMNLKYYDYNSMYITKVSVRLDTELFEDDSYRSEIEKIYKEMVSVL